MQVGTHWMLVRDGAGHNKIVVDSFDNATGKFTAHYYQIDNASQFSGTVSFRERSLLTMIQEDASHGYHAAHVRRSRIR
jgi:hypothetical protein